MESLLLLMNDETLIGTIETATSIGENQDDWPVFRHHPSSHWNRSDNLTMDRIFPRSHNEKMITNDRERRTPEAHEQRRPVYHEEGQLGDWELSAFLPHEKQHPLYHEEKEHLSQLNIQRDPFADELLNEYRKQSDHNVTTCSDNSIPDNWESLVSPTDLYDDAMDEACQALGQCRHRKNRTRELAEKAVKLIEEYKLTKIGIFCRGLVHFPDLLERFLRVQKEKDAQVDEDDLACMFARCIEHRADDTFAAESVKHLLAFKGDQTLELKLLPKKYSIDTALYEFVRQANVRDSYYDATQLCEHFFYAHPDVVAKERSGRYTGFRDAYHCLLYGDVGHLQALIVSWDLWGDNCTADAAREFFGLSEGCPIEAVKAHINKKSRLH